MERAATIIFPTTVRIWIVYSLSVNVLTDLANILPTILRVRVRVSIPPQRLSKDTIILKLILRNMAHHVAIHHTVTKVSTLAVADEAFRRVSSVDRRVVTIVAVADIFKIFTGMRVKVRHSHHLEEDSSVNLEM